MTQQSKWLVLAFAFSATVINYLDRQTLSVLAPVLLVQYQISAESYARIVSAFMLAYTISNGLSGRLLDRMGGRAGYAATIALWSAAEMLHAFAKGALGLGVCRFFLGIGEAGNYPAGVKLIAEWFPVKERSLAGGIFNSGASIGAILAPPLLAWIALSFGIRAAFLIVGLSGFLWLAAWLTVYKRPPRNSMARLAPVATSQLLQSKFLWQFTLSKVFSDPVWYFYTFWFPQYLRAEFQFTLKEIGATAWIPFFTAAVGNIAGGLLFVPLSKWSRSPQISRRMSVLIFSALMMSALGIPASTSPTMSIALVSIATFGYSGALANLLALPADVFRQDAVASVWGFASVGSGFGGMLFALITGWIVQHYSFVPAFVLFGVLPVVSAVLIWTLPKDAGFTPSSALPEIAS
jgi:MFS transporter, ACS family, hexuronate transporter